MKEEGSMFIVPKEGEELYAGSDAQQYETDGPIFEVVDNDYHSLAVGSHVKRFIKDGRFSGYVNAEGHTQWIRDRALVEVQHD